MGKETFYGFSEGGRIHSLLSKNPHVYHIIILFFPQIAVVSFWFSYDFMIQFLVSEHVSLGNLIAYSSFMFMWSISQLRWDRWKKSVVISLFISGFSLIALILLLFTPGLLDILELTPIITILVSVIIVVSLLITYHAWKYRDSYELDLDQLLASLAESEKK